jgi:hypothetical protein
MKKFALLSSILISSFFAQTAMASAVCKITWRDGTVEYKYRNGDCFDAQIPCWYPFVCTFEWL